MNGYYIDESFCNSLQSRMPKLVAMIQDADDAVVNQELLYKSDWAKYDKYATKDRFSSHGLFWIETSSYFGRFGSYRSLWENMHGFLLYELGPDTIYTYYAELVIEEDFVNDIYYDSSYKRLATIYKGDTFRTVSYFVKLNSTTTYVRADDKIICMDGSIYTIKGDRLIPDGAYNPMILTDIHSLFNKYQASDNIPLRGISLSKNNVLMTEGETCVIDVTYTPSNASNKAISWTSSNDNVAKVNNNRITAVKEGTATISAVSQDGHHTATCIVNVQAQAPYVDLGLSVKWARMNVKATKPEGYGKAFAWGETSSKSTYKWSTYKWCNGSAYSLTKYCYNSKFGKVDNKTTLESADDAAHVILGGGWRIPTVDEWEELFNSRNCTWVWSELNGVKGMKITSKISGYSGNWIFLPAAGYVNENGVSGSGNAGCYWSSSIYFSSDSYYLPMPEEANALFFYTDFSKKIDGYPRYYGCLIRPVIR